MSFKRALAIMLTLVMFLAVFPLSEVTAFAAEGRETPAPSEETFAEETSAEENPAEETPAEDPRGNAKTEPDLELLTDSDWTVFAGQISDGYTFEGQLIALGADINVTVPAGDSTHAFKGTFDGQGHTVHLNISVTTEFAAMFACTDGATLRNLNFDGTVSGGIHSASLVGKIANSPGSLIENVTSTALVTTLTGSHLGGIIGHASESTTTVRNCVFAGQITGARTAAAIVGWADGAHLTIENCLEAGAQYTASGFNPIALCTIKPTAADCYYLTARYGSPGRSHQLGDRVYTSTTDFAKKVRTFDNVGYYLPVAPDTDLVTVYQYNNGNPITVGLNVWVGESFLIQDVDYTISIMRGGAAVSQMTNLGFYTISVYGMGNYTGHCTVGQVEVIEALTYIIDTEYTTGYYLRTDDDWTRFAKLVSGGFDFYGDRVFLDGDITVTAMAGTPDRPFMGVFDGSNPSNGTQHKLTLDLEGTPDGIAPFCSLDGAVVRFLEVDGVIESEYSKNAGLAVHASNDTTIMYCTCSAAINTSFVNAAAALTGGFVALVDEGEILFNNCAFRGSFSGENGNAAGGFAAMTVGSVSLYSCVFAPTSLPSYTEDCATFVRGTIDSIENCYYTSSYGTAQGVEAALAPDEDAFLRHTAVCGIDLYAWVRIQITWGSTEYTYNDGAEVPVSLSLTFDGSEPVCGTDYSLSYKMDGVSYPFPTSVGVYDVFITGLGSYTGSVSIGRISVLHTLPQDGDGNYIITYDYEWDYFCSMLEAGDMFENKTVLLADDISISHPAASEGHRFKGVFDGQGFRITIEATADSVDTAIFRAVENATIRNLIVDGTIESQNYKFAASVSAEIYGISVIENCVSYLTIESTLNGDGTHGGFVGVVNTGAHLTMTNCVFLGSLLGPNTTKCSGMVGYNKGYICFTDCVFDPQEVTFGDSDAATFNRNANADFTRCYFTASFGTVQGESIMNYDMFCYVSDSMIARVVNVMDCEYYLTNDLTVLGIPDVMLLPYEGPLMLEPAVSIAGVASGPDEGLEYTLYDSDWNWRPGLIISETGGYILDIWGDWTHYAGYMTIEFSVVQAPPTNNSGNFRIASAADWAQFVSLLDEGCDFTGVTVELEADITVTSPAASDEHPFRGVFEGNGHTVTLNILAQSASAMFMCVRNATIRNLNIAGSVMVVSASDAAMDTAALVVNSAGEDRFENIIVTATVLCPAANSAGIVGRATGSKIYLYRCAFKGVLNGGDTAAGILGRTVNGAYPISADCLEAASQAVATNYYPLINTSSGGVFTMNCHVNEGNTAGDVFRVYTTPPAEFHKKVVLCDGETYYWISSSAIDNNGMKYGYTGEEIDPIALVIFFDGINFVILNEGEHFTVSTSPSPMKDVGVYTLTVTGIGDYGGTITGTAEVINGYASGFYSITDESDVTQITSEMTALNGESTWVVIGSVTIDARLEITGYNNIMMTRGSSLTVTGGIHVPEGASLYFYGLTDSDAFVTVPENGPGYGEAGIGGNSGEAIGSIGLYGVTVVSHGGYGGAGIGGGMNTVFGMFNMPQFNFAVVTAYGGYGAAGIGGGLNGAARPKMYFSTVEAYGGEGAPGIGWTVDPGALAPIELAGCKVKAVAGAGCGYGIGGPNCDTNFAWYRMDDYVETSAVSGRIDMLREFVPDGIFCGLKGGCSFETGRVVPADIEVTVDPNGAGERYTLSARSGCVISIADPVREGYTFAGWYKADGELCDLTIPLTRSFDLYARWERAAYTIVFDANCGEGEMDDMPFTGGIAAELPENTFTRQYHNFIGWALKPAGAVVYHDCEMINNVPGAVAGGTVTLYAVWEKIVYTITYYGGPDGDGFTNPNPTGVTYDSGVIEFVPASHERIAFLGWFADPELTRPISSFDPLEGHDLTIYAKWDLKYVDENGEEQYVSKFTVLTGSSSTYWLRDGFYVALDDAEYTMGFYTTGDAKLLLADGRNLSVTNYGVMIQSDSSLTIYGQKLGTGTLYASNSSRGAGIGGNFSNGQHATLTIVGGIIEAHGGEDSAGIGGGRNNYFGTINILGGTVTAYGNTHGAGIGCGVLSNISEINISGGNITAAGGAYGAGIGLGYMYYVSSNTYTDPQTLNINITGGNITATGGNNAAGLGSGRGDYRMERTVNIVISGGVINASGGTSGAGIGTGTSHKLGSTTITLNGGEAHGVGGTYGAGIGGGESGLNVTINLNGGGAYAAAGSGAAALGCGYNSGNVKVYLRGGAAALTAGNNSTAFGSAEVYSEETYTNGEYELWHDEFDDTDKAACANRVITPEFAYYLVTGWSDSGANEGPEKAVDFNFATKWTSEGSYRTPYVEFMYDCNVSDVGTRPTGYVITVANDAAGNPGYNPSSWTVKARYNSYEDWTVLDTVTNDAVLRDENGASYLFPIDNTRNYRYFRIELNPDRPEYGFAIAEFRPFGVYNMPDYYDFTYASLFVASVIVDDGHPRVTVHDRDGAPLTEGVDYVVSFSNETEGGNCTVTATGIGSFYGSISRTFARRSDTYYIDANGDEQPIAASDYLLYPEDCEDDPYTLTSGTYIVMSNFEALERIVISGTVDLILADGARLDAERGISVGYGNTLNVYGQRAGTGRLEALGTENEDAAIGGDGLDWDIIDWDTFDETIPLWGTINICGGDIFARGAYTAAAIGGGGSNYQGGDILIAGGSVTAIGQGGNAAIGGSLSCGFGSITISGGEVNAYSTGANSYSNNSTVIGGQCWIAPGTVTISGGFVLARGALAEDSDDIAYADGCAAISGTNVNIFITGGVIRAYGAKDCVAIGGMDTYSSDQTQSTVTISGGVVSAHGGQFSAGIGTCEGGRGGSVTITDGMVIAYGGPGIKNDTYSWSGGGAGIGDGAYGIGCSVTISGGTVSAHGGLLSAGIGGSSGYVKYLGETAASHGNITISGGTIMAFGGEGGAGIGGAGTDSDYYQPDNPDFVPDSGFGLIRITGGNIQAYGEARSDDDTLGGAGIGGGSECQSSNSIFLTGGVIYAYGAGTAAAIGAGTGGNTSNLTILLMGSIVESGSEMGTSAFGAASVFIYDTAYTDGTRTYPLGVMSDENKAAALGRTIRPNRPYTITFVNYDGTVLGTDSRYYGETPVYSGETPVKPGTAEFEYVFTGWSPEIEPVTGEATYTAVFEEQTATYVIRFVNWDGEELQSGSLVYGAMPVYNGPTPTRTGDPHYRYTFTGWSPEISAVTGNADYTAQFSRIELYPVWVAGVQVTSENQYNITGEGIEGDVMYGGDFSSGTLHLNFATIESDIGILVEDYGDDFELTIEIFYPCYINAESYGIKCEAPKLKIKGTDVPALTLNSEGVGVYADGDLTIMDYLEMSVNASDSAIVTGGRFEVASVALIEANTAGGEYALAAEDIFITGYGVVWAYGGSAYDVYPENSLSIDDGSALHTDSIYNHCIVRFRDGSDWDEMSDQIIKANTPTALNLNTFTSDFEFLGWNTDPYGEGTFYADGEEVTLEEGVVTLYAQWHDRFTVTFKNWDGTVLQSNIFYYYEYPEYTGETPTREGSSTVMYEFSGWTPELDYVTGDAEYTAVFTEIELYPIWVAGVRVTSANKDNITGEGITGTVSYEGGGNGGTLTLENAAIFGETGIDVTPSRNFCFEIEVIGENTILAVEEGIHCTTTVLNITFDDDATLDVVSESTGIMNSDGSIVVNNGELNVTAEYGLGIYAYGTLSFDGANVTVTAGDYGISSITYIILMNAAAVTVEGVEYDVYTYDGLNISEAAELIADNVYGYCVVKYDGNGGTGNMKRQFVRVGMPTVLRPNEFTSDFDFLGWNTAADGSGTNYDDGQDVTFEEGCVTLYAQWHDHFTIRFLNWDGTVLQTSSVLYGETPAYTGETPTRPDSGGHSYTFEGWSPEIAAVTGDADYYAQYTESAALPGDVNVDGVLNTFDALLVLRFALGLIQLSPEAAAVADVSGDGLVNTFDALLVLRAALGLIQL